MIRLDRTTGIKMRDVSFAVTTPKFLPWDGQLDKSRLKFDRPKTNIDSQVLGAYSYTLACQYIIELAINQTKKKN